MKVRFLNVGCSKTVKWRDRTEYRL